MHLIFSHCITISLLDDSMLKNRLPPGTIIDVIVPLSKSAQTSCTNPKSLSVSYIYHFFMFEVHSFLPHSFPPHYKFLSIYM